MRPDSGYATESAKPWIPEYQVTSKIVLPSLFSALVAFLLAETAFALELPGEEAPSASFAREIEYSIPEAELTAQQVWFSENQFSPIPERYIDLGRTRKTVWLRANVTNAEQAPRVARLDIGRQYVERVHIYVIRGKAPSTPELVYSATDKDPFSVRPVDDLILVTDLQFAAGETLGLLIGYSSVDTTWMPLRIGSVRAIDDEHGTTVTIDWIINGALVAMVVFALLMAPVIGWRLAGSFAIYILTATAYVAHADGYTFRYLWPDAPGSHDAVRLFLILLMPVAALNFAQHLFNFSSYRWLVRSMQTLMVVAGCCALGAPWIVQISWLMTLAYLLVPVGSLIQVTAGAMAIRSKQLGAVPYTFGAIFVCSSFIYAAAAHLQPGLWDVDFTLDYGHLALFGETISFGLAIALRLRGLRREATNAQSQAAEARQQLDALNHDIRQPLIALREGIAKLEGGDLQEQMTTAFDYLESLARHGPVVDQQDTTEPFAASMILDGVREMFEDDAKRRGVTLNIARADVPLQSDPMALMRIVSNLVANALEHGGDRVDVEVSSSQPVVLSIVDNGSGMDEETLQQQLQRGVSGTGQEGRGLGLDIVQSMSDSIDAVFTLESTPGEGTKACVTLPQ